MRIIKKISVMLLAFYVQTHFVSCSYAELDPDTEQIPDDDITPNGDFTSNRPDQDPLNVVYFIPTDLVDEYESKEDTIKSNASEAVIFAQQWFKKQMELAGHPNKTFALFTRNSNTEVQIIPVYGSKSSDQYATNKEVRSETKTYLENNLDQIGGQHTLILCDYDAGFANNATRRMAVTSSPDDYTMVSTGKILDGLPLLTSEKYGALLHELGHALNAPHVAHQASDLPYRSLMGGGGTNRWNAGGWEDQIKLVASSIAIFDESEAFNKTTNTIDYYTVEPNVKLVSFTIEKDNSKHATVASFTFTSDITAEYLYVAMDAEPTTTNKNYDLVSFTTAATPTGNSNEYTAELEMPYSEFFNNFSRNGIKTDNNIELSVNILTENGFREIPLTYKFTISSANSPEPDNNINKFLTPLSDRLSWTITANTTSHGQPVAQGAPKMLDGDLNTFWFSDWPTVSASATPHIINVDMETAKTFAGIYLHSYRTPNPQFRPKHVLVEVSADQSTYTVAKDYTQAVNNQDIRIRFDNEQTARYIRITVDEVFTGNGVENLTINELDIIID